MSSPPRVAPVSDHDQLRALLQRYARAADQRDTDALRALFHPDAVVEGARGRLALDDWLRTMAEPSPFAASMHVLGEPLVELGPDGATGRLDTYAVVYQLAGPDSDRHDLTLGVRYLDRVVRMGGGWVIAERVAGTVWLR